MKMSIVFNLLVGLLIFSASGAANEISRDLFRELLQEGQLEFNQAEGFSELALEEDFLLPYEKRLVSKDGQLEVRYSIRPLERIEIDYDDPHSSAPAANDLFEMLFRTITETMAKDSHPVSRAYLPEDAKKEFNAGWVSVAVFDVSAQTTDKYHQAMLIAIHHNDKADAYTLFLTNDLQQEKERIKRLRTSLKFVQFEKDVSLSSVDE